MNHYTIKDLEVLSGIKAHTIRIWEKRYGLLQPKRSTTNIRFYSDDELKKLLNVSMLVKRGYKISKVADFDDSRIREEILKFTCKPLSADDVVGRLVVHMVNFDEESFEDLLNQQVATLGLEETTVSVIFPLFENIGINWQVGAIFPAQEHFVSNIVRQLFIKESLAYKNHQSEETVLFFLKEGELHELSLLFYNYIALKAGYRTIYLGQNVPLEDLVKIAAMKNFERVFTSFVNGIEPAALQAYLVKLETVFANKRVFISGAQISKNQPVIPAGFRFIPDIRSFKKYFEMEHQY